MSEASRNRERMREQLSGNVYQRPPRNKQGPICTFAFQPSLFSEGAEAGKYLFIGDRMSAVEVILGEYKSRPRPTVNRVAELIAKGYCFYGQDGSEVKDQYDPAHQKTIVAPPKTAEFLRLRPDVARVVFKLIQTETHDVCLANMGGDDLLAEVEGGQFTNMGMVLLGLPYLYIRMLPTVPREVHICIPDER